MSNSRNNRPQVSELPPSLQSLTREGFIYQKTLGSGAFGLVYLMQYEGSNNEYKNLCNDNAYLVVKEFKYNHSEPSIARSQNQANQNEISISQALGVGCEILTNHLERPQFLATKIISYGEEENHTPRCASLEHYLSTMIENMAPDNIEGAFANDNLKGSLNNLITSLHNELNNLHQQGYLHRDIGLRNIMISRLSTENLKVKLIDFGNAARFNESMQVTTDGMFFLQTTDSSALASKAGVADIRTYSLTTDLFAVKSIILDAIALCASDFTPSNSEEFIRKAREAYNSRSIESTNHSGRATSPHELDTNRLQLCYSLINTHLNELFQDKDISENRYITLKTILYAYERYLTSSPDSAIIIDRASFELACQQNNQLLAQAQQLINAPEIESRVQLDIERFQSGIDESEEESISHSPRPGGGYV